MLKAVLAISMGASCGAILRWLLGLWLNPLVPLIPLGTLAANTLGGYGIGMALAVFSSMPWMAPEWRLFVITGFFGALTTFSTFSAEAGVLLQQHRIILAAGFIALHVACSLVALFLGMGTVELIRRMFQGV